MDKVPCPSCHNAMMINNLLQNPDSGGTPAVDKLARMLVKLVIRIRVSNPPILFMSVVPVRCSSEDDVTNSSDLKIA